MDDIKRWREEFLAYVSRMNLTRDDFKGIVAYMDEALAIEPEPSAEPEQPPEIQDILNYLDTVLHPIVSPEHWDVYAELHDMISSLPTEQPEPLTDKEQRIFLTAMAREEKVCRQVDDECRDRTPYEVSLVHVCKEIRRKVKGALWA